MLREGDAVLVPTQGSSMHPLIPEGCCIRVEPTSAAALRLGDVIVYRVGEALMAHRLLGKRGDGGSLCLITKGDAISWRFREEVAPEQVLGRVSVVNWRRGLHLHIDSGWGRVLSLILAATWPLPQGLFRIFVKFKTALTKQSQAVPDSRA
jgi:signal peptidase I